jgi:hypothetical protein
MSLVKYITRYFTLRLLWMGLFSWFLSLLIHCWFIEKLLRFVYWFCILSQMLIRYYKIFWWSLLGVLSIGWYHLQIRILWYCPFLFIFLFISFSFFFAMAGNSSPILNMSGESGHPCLLPHFRGNRFSFPHLLQCCLWVCHT